MILSDLTSLFYEYSVYGFSMYWWIFTCKDLFSMRSWIFTFVCMSIVGPSMNAKVNFHIRGLKFYNTYTRWPYESATVFNFDHMKSHFRKTMYHLLSFPKGYRGNFWPFLVALLMHIMKMSLSFIIGQNHTKIWPKQCRWWCISELSENDKFAQARGWP